MIHRGEHVTCDISGQDEFSYDYVRLGGTTQIDNQRADRLFKFLSWRAEQREM